MRNVLSASVLVILAVITLAAPPKSQSKIVVLEAEAVLQWGSYLCGPAIATALFKHLGLTDLGVRLAMSTELNTQNQPASYTFAHRDPELTLPMQSLLATAMHWDYEHGTCAANWVRAVNLILGRTYHLYGGSYKQFPIVIPSTGIPQAQKSAHFNNIHSIIRTSLELNMPVAFGVIPPQSSRPANAIGPAGHFLLIDGTEGRDPTQGFTIYRFIDPGTGGHHELQADTMFAKPGYSLLIIAFVPQAHEIRHPQIKSLEETEGEIANIYAVDHFGCDRTFGKSPAVTSRCPTFERPHWGAGDKLSAYNLRNGTKVSELKLSKSTAAAVLYQGSKTSILSYLEKLMGLIEWTSDSAKRSRDVNNVKGFVDKHFDYFKYKLAKLTGTDLTYKHIRVVADFGGHKFDPKRNIYLVDEANSKEDIEYDVGDKLIWEHFNCEPTVGEHTELRKRIANHGSKTCPTVDHPYWESRDYLHSYSANGKAMCEVQFSKLTAAGIFHQKTPTSFSKYLEKVIKGVQWKSTLSQKNRNVDAENTKKYIERNIEHFQFKVAELTTTAANNQAVRVTAECTFNGLGPVENIIVVNV